MDAKEQNRIKALLSVLDVPAFFLKDGEILCANALAQKLMICEGPAEEPLAALDAGQSHVLSAELCGKRQTLSCKSWEGGLLCQLAPLSQQAAVPAEYLDIISGELRKPLGELMLALQQLYPTLPDTAQAGRNAAQAQRNVYRLLRLASQLNAGSSVKGGKWQLVRQTEDLCTWLDALALQAESLCSYSKAGFRFEGLNAPFVGSADLEKLERAIWNLLSNALLHAPEGSCVSMQAQRSGSRLILSVSNETDADSEALSGNIFAHDTERLGTEPAKDGLGFGLSIARACAELHGGLMLITREKDGSTTATLSIPIAEPEAGDLHAAPMFDYSGGLDHGLLELSEALDPEAFSPQGL